MPVIEISSLEHPGVEIFCTLTEAQLRRQTESGKGLFIAESPNVISRALDAGYEPIALLCERKHIPSMSPIVPDHPYRRAHHHNAR